MKLPPPMGGLREAGHEPMTLATDFRPYPDACTDECEDSHVDNSAESDSNPAIMAAVKVLLQGLGEDVTRDGLKKTPLRVAKAFRDGTRGYCQIIKDIVGGAIFPEAGVESGAGRGGGNGGLVVVRNIDHFSYCEACLLPFKVRFHIGYVSSSQRVVGLSKLSRVAEVFAKRLQAPQRLADEVSKVLHETIRPLGVAVVLECWHVQFPGVQGNAYKFNSQAEEMPGWLHFPVHRGTGVFEDENSDAWSEFIAVLSLGGVNIERSCSNAYTFQQRSWCPFQVVDGLHLPVINDRTVEHGLRCNGHGLKRISCINSQLNSKLQAKHGVSYSMMIGAVESILIALGEDHKREELRVTPARFVWWLLNFRLTNPALQVNGVDWNGANSVRRGSPPVLHTTLGSTDIDCSHFLFEINVPFFSQCEHHLLPFFGVAHIGYFSVTENEELDRSKINSIVQFFSQKLQVQERLTKQIAEAVHSACNTVDVMVVLEASHICMLSRGIEKIGSNTATVTVLGRFVTDSAAKAAFFKKIVSRDAHKK